MKLRGYSVEDQDADDVRHADFAEINMWASPDELRRIAAFLSQAADAMDRMGDAYDHEHLSHRQPDFDDSPHFVVMRSR